MAGRKQHQPTKVERDTVSLHAMVGTPQEDIAKLIGISVRTLRKHYRNELDFAVMKANAAIGGALFNKAKAGDTTAQIFWMKTRARWSEKEQEKSGADEMAEALNKLVDKLPGA